MKTKILFTLTLLFALSIAVSGCKKDKDDPDGGDTALGTKVEAGGNIFFRCKIDGQAFEAKFVQSFQTNGGGTATTLWQYMVYGESASGAWIQASLQNLQFNKITAGTYDMEQGSQEYTVSVQYFDGTEFWSGAGGAQIPGEVKITSIAGSSTAGTFNFSVRDLNATRTLVITEGSYSTDKYKGDV